MAQGFCKFARQIGGHGAFAAVRLEVQPSSMPKPVVVADSEAIAVHYVPAVRTGIDFAREQLLAEGQSPPQVNVTILEVTENPADAHVMFFVYAACIAYCDAVGLSLKRPIDFDHESRQILLPLGLPRER